MKKITHLVFGGHALKSLNLCGVLRYIYCYNLDINIKSVKCNISIDKTLSSKHITNDIINQYVDKKDIYQQIKEQMIFFKKWHHI